MTSHVLAFTFELLILVIFGLGTFYLYNYQSKKKNFISMMKDGNLFKKMQIKQQRITLIVYLPYCV